MKGLTVREREVIFLLACSFNTKEIGWKLGMSSRMASSYIRRSCWKLGLTRWQLIDWIRKQNEMAS